MAEITTKQAIEKLKFMLEIAKYINKDSNKGQIETFEMAIKALEEKDSEKNNYKKYTVILKEYDGGGRNATSKSNENFEELDWAAVMYCVTEDVIEQTGMTLDQIFSTLKPFFR